MKMTKTGWILASVFGAAMLLGAGAALYAADSTEHVGDHHGGGMHHFADSRLGQFLGHRAGKFHDLQSELALSDEQKTAFHDCVKSHHEQIAAAIKPVAECRHALRDAVLADPIDETAIRSAADKLGKSIGDAAVEMAKVKTDLKNQVKLTPEQEATLKKFRAEHDADVDSLLSPAH